jgi:uncharacterized membrane protein YgcG
MGRGYLRIPLFLYLNNVIIVLLVLTTNKETPKIKTPRFLTAISMVFLPLLFALPASATTMTLQEAQAALVVAQQEVIDATASLQTASEAVLAATTTRDTAQIEYNEALVAWEATRVTIPGTTSTGSQNVVLNGNFNDASNWTNIGMGSNDTIINSSIPRVYNGVLIGSYIYHFVLQTGNFPSPTRQVTFSYDMSNNNFNDGNRPQADGYRVEFRTYNASNQRLNYYDTGNRTDTFPWTNFTATYNLTDDAVRWDIGFRMVDNGFWNGNFAGSIDNVSLVTQVTTTSPETYSYGEAETTAKNSAYQVLGLAQTSLSLATAEKSSAETRLATANAEVIRLTQLVADLTPHLDAPTNLVATIVGDNVELSWSAPNPSLSGVTPERYGVFWSTTNFTQNGWAVASTTTSITIPLSTLYSTAPQGSTFQFAIRADNDTLSIYSDRSTYASVTTEVPPWWQIQFWEGETVTISAPEGFKFGTPVAWYGSPTDPTCGATVSDILNEIINGRTTATFSADNGLFGDPCGGVVKVLRLSTPVDRVIVPTPTPTPTETPVIIVPEPTPSPQPEPTVDPTPEPEETVEPTPEPTVPPTEEPTPSPSPSEEPTEEPTENVVDPTPEPEPEPTPEESTEPELLEQEAVEEIENLVSIDPESLTEAQVEELTTAAMVVFETAEQGSEAYNQALEALAAVAEADDPKIPEELAAIPLLGDAAGAALEVLNNLGNVGADMAPAVREEAEKTIIASVIATGAAVQATVAAATAAATTATSTSGTSSGGGGGASGGSSGGGTNRKVK